MARAAPPSSPSSPSSSEPLKPRRYGSMEDIMRRTPTVDAPPPVARARVYTDYDDLVCETCGSGDRDDALILCDSCNRGHHTFCLHPVVTNVPVGPWFCPACVSPAKATKSRVQREEERAHRTHPAPPVSSAATGHAAPSSSSPSSPQLGQKHTAALTTEPPTLPRLRQRECSMDDIMRRAPTVDAPLPVARARVYTYYDDLVCKTCGSGDRDDDLIICDRCEHGHHIFCLRPIVAKVPIGHWFCPVCAPIVAKAPKSFPMKQTKITDFFGIQKDGQDAQPAKCRRSKDARRRRKCPLVMHKKKRRILPFVPSEDRARRLKQMASLATALISSKTKFSNELTYEPNMDRTSNEAILEEGGMQVLSKEDKTSIELCRAMQRRGECPPLLVVFDSIEGFTVQADADIKAMTFIAEYTGDVHYLEKRANDDIDCIMTLLLTADPSKNLVICPDKRGNISRFISGINNHTLDGKKKQNVKCVRYNIDGESHVLLVACRDIACGEKLYYDYNGYEHAYPTHHFQ